MDTTIKVDTKTRDRLASIAVARGTTMRGLLEEFAEASLTPQELRERAERTRAFLSAEFGHRLSADEAGDLRSRMRAAQTAHRDALRGSAGSGSGDAEAGAEAA
ncbi:hypothetical protein [Streptomyces sp. NPDC088400]|uniref:hypothetical protein n=1 Tax=Streptomyces sp. NPDC088400 TaxID=3365861 RepID=UPI003820FE8E